MFTPLMGRYRGHSSHGYAGYYLALVVSGSLYYGLCGAGLLLTMCMGIAEVARCPIRLRPLHPDACSGFRPLGTLLLWMYACVAGAALALFAVYRMGYFGLEHLPGMWFAIMCAVMMAPVVFVLPTRAIHSALSHARLARLLELEQEAQFCYEQLHKLFLSPEEGETGTYRERLQHLTDAIEINRQIPVWPFDVIALRTVAATYLLQIGIVAIEKFIG